MFADILRVLANRGPLKTIHIMQKTNVNSKTFREYAEFLVKQGLVEERSSNGGRITYEITPRGVLVLKGLKELEKVLLPSDTALTRGQSRKGGQFPLTCARDMYYNNRSCSLVKYPGPLSITICCVSNVDHIHMLKYQV
jgi:predicted transcriptional regulator